MKDLKMLRTIKGCTMSEVAAAIGTTRQYYNYVEKACNKGDHNVLSAKNETLWRRLADFFGIDVFELLGSDILSFAPRNEKEIESIKKHVMDGIE